MKYEKDVENGETVLRAERYYGKIQRAFALGQEVDEATAQAKYNDGVLRHHAGEENRSGSEKARGALSGASNSTNSIDPASAGFLLLAGAGLIARSGCS